MNARRELPVTVRRYWKADLGRRIGLDGKVPRIAGASVSSFEKTMRKVVATAESRCESGKLTGEAWASQ